MSTRHVRWADREMPLAIQLVVIEGAIGATFFGRIERKLLFYPHQFFPACKFPA